MIKKTLKSLKRAPVRAVAVLLFAAVITMIICALQASNEAELQNYEENIKNVSLENVLNEADFVWNKAPKATGILYAKENE